MWKHLDDYQIILGSQSPRRVELLRGLDLPFEQIRLEGVDESYPTDLPLEEIPPLYRPRGRRRLIAHFSVSARSSSRLIRWSSLGIKSSVSPVMLHRRRRCFAS